MITCAVNLTIWDNLFVSNTAVADSGAIENVCFVLPLESHVSSCCCAMKASNSLHFGSQSAVRIWLGMLATGGQQKGALNVWLVRVSLRVKKAVIKLPCTGVYGGLCYAESLLHETVPVQEVYNRVSPTPREFTIVREDSKNKCISSSVSRIVDQQRSCSVPATSMASHCISMCIR